MPLRFAPLIVFVIVALLAGAALLSHRDPAVIPSALIGRPAPVLALKGLASADMKQGPVFVNFFASWCVPCRAEQKVLEKISKEVPIYGVAYKDKPADTQKFLAETENPFTAIGEDADGRAAIDWGVSGVPETFLIGKNGTVQYRHTGPMTEEVYNDVLKPLLREAGK